MRLSQKQRLSQITLFAGSVLILTFFATRPAGELPPMAIFIPGSIAVIGLYVTGPWLLARLFRCSKCGSNVGWKRVCHGCGTSVLELDAVDAESSIAPGPLMAEARAEAAREFPNRRNRPVNLETPARLYERISRGKAHVGKIALALGLLSGSAAAVFTRFEGFVLIFPLVSVLAGLFFYLIGDAPVVAGLVFVALFRLRCPACRARIAEIHHIGHAISVEFDYPPYCGSCGQPFTFGDADNKCTS